MKTRTKQQLKKAWRAVRPAAVAIVACAVVIVVVIAVTSPSTAPDVAGGNAVLRQMYGDQR